MAILPIPTTRVSDYLARTRLVQQTQSDQLDLFRLQNQISTGRRIFQPSDDAPSALRAITLQRTLERKAQLQINLGSAQDSLVSAEAALTEVGSILNSIRAQALGVAGTTATDEERLTTRTEVLTALEQLVDFANSTYQDSYLFAGSRAFSSPYVFNGDYVEYLGDEVTQQVRVDSGVLFDASIPGDDVFGGLSDPVRGTSDLQPQLTLDTRLSELNGGAGITSGGGLEIAYVPFASGVETESVVVDLSTARTVGDVVRLIEANGPPSADLRVSVSGSGLLIETEPESATPGSVVIREVAGGETASELGVLTESPTTNITGSDTDPLIGLTTELSDLLGTKSQGRLSLSGNNNDLVLTAAVNGADFNGVQVDLVDATTVGSEVAVYDDSTNTLTVSIESGVSTASQIAAAIEAEGTFQAEIDYRDADSAVEAGGGVVLSGSQTGVTSGGSGDSLDLASGLQITNGGEPFAIDTSGAETVEDLLNVLNQTENGLFASINATGTGIDIRTRRSGADFTIGENGGSLASQLGVRTYTLGTRLEDFNRGLGVIVDDTGPSGNEFTIEITDAGVTTAYQIDLVNDPDDPSDDLKTVDDVIDAINDTGVVNASLATTGNGITLSTGLVALNAEGTVGLEGDTLTFAADTPGVAGNQTFTIEYVDSGSGGLSTSVLGNAITIDLGGVDSSTDLIAADISAQLTGYTVTSDGTATVATTSAAVGAAPEAFDAVGGSEAGADLITISGDAAQRLGFFAEDADPQQAVSTTGSVTSGDRHTIEVDSVFNTLIRLGEALLGGDDAVQDIAEAIDRLDDDLDRATASRGEIGSRLRSLESLQYRLEDEEIELRATLSDELDVDLTQAISDFTARQISLEASLQTTASLLQLTILNYL